MAVFGNTKTKLQTSTYTGGSESQTSNLGDDALKSPAITISGSDATGSKNVATTNTALQWQKSFNDLTDSVDTANNSNLNWGDNSIIVSDWGIYNVVGSPIMGGTSTDTQISDSTTGDIIPNASTESAKNKDTSKGGSGMSQKSILIIALIAGAIIIFKNKK